MRWNIIKRLMMELFLVDFHSKKYKSVVLRNLFGDGLRGYSLTIRPLLFFELAFFEQQRLFILFQIPQNNKTHLQVKNSYARTTDISCQQAGLR